MAIIVLDFDGTCVTHEFPYIGKDIGSVPILHKLLAKGHQFILFTMRSDHDTECNAASEEYPDIRGGKYLSDALEWFRIHDIPLYGIQTNPTQHTWTKSPKAYGNLIIDDCALGCPLIYDTTKSLRPFVDWIKVEELLENKGLI